MLPAVQEKLSDIFICKNHPGNISRILYKLVVTFAFPQILR